MVSKELKVVTVYSVIFALLSLLGTLILEADPIAKVIDYSICALIIILALLAYIGENNFWRIKGVLIALLVIYIIYALMYIALLISSLILYGNTVHVSQIIATYSISLILVIIPIVYIFKSFDTIL